MFMWLKFFISLGTFMLFKHWNEVAPIQSNTKTEVFTQTNPVKYYYWYNRFDDN